MIEKKTATTHSQEHKPSPEALKVIRLITAELNELQGTNGVNSLKMLPTQLAQKVLTNLLYVLLRNHPEQWTINGYIALHQETNTRLYIREGYRRLDECIEMRNDYSSYSDKYVMLKTVPNNERKELYKLIQKIRTNQSVKRIEDRLPSKISKTEINEHYEPNPEAYNAKTVGSKKLISIRQP